MRRRWFAVSMTLLVCLLMVGCGIPQEDHDAVVAERDAAQAQAASLQSKYDSANSELTEIKRVYPPQYFSSASELRDWLAGNDISERSDVTVAESLIDKAFALQEDALADGYIISVNIQEDLDYFYVAGTTLIDGYVWAFDIETDEVIQWSTLIQIR